MTESLLPFQEFMQEGGYLCAQEIEGDRYVAVMPLLFTSAIIIGRMRDYMIGYDDRWCYHNEADAICALALWAERGYEGEPEGWHRHPASGRRREDGDPAKETIYL